MKNNQRGFTLVEGLLVIIAATLITFAGWYVWNANKKEDTTKESVATKGDNVSKTDSSKKDTKKYMEIKELGIKFQINDKLKNAYYTMTDGGAYVSVHEYDNIPGFEGCRSLAGEGSGLAAVSYARVGDDHFGSPWTESELADKPYTTNIDGTYYWFEPASQAPCWDFNAIPESDPDVQALGGYKSAFVEQGKTFAKL